MAVNYHPEWIELEFKGETLRVQRVDMPGAGIIYRVLFPGRRPPLILTRADRFQADRFWTSLPQGRQKEAEEIGPLIAEFINSHS